MHKPRKDKEESVLEKRLCAAFNALSFLGYNRGRDGGGKASFVAEYGDNLELGVRNAAWNLIRNVINGETFEDVSKCEIESTESPYDF
jgi:hypothetical protein